VVQRTDWVLSLAVWLAMGMADATVVQFTDRATFAAQGTLVYDYDFSDFGSSNTFTVPGGVRSAPWYRGGITYRSSLNMVMGPAAWFRPIANVIYNDEWAPLRGDIEEPLSMFGFDIGYFGRPPVYAPPIVTVEIHTNVGDYVLSDLTIPYCDTALQFMGFATTGSAEYFTGFTFRCQGAPDPSHAVMTDVALGTFQSGVPEPSSLSLLAACVAAGGVLTLRRRRK